METQSKTVPTESQIQVLMSDWLANLRSQENGNFTHKGKGGIQTVHSSVLDYLLGTPEKQPLKLIKQARRAAEQVVNAVVPEPKVIRVGGADSFQGMSENGHVINLATDYFDDTSLTTRDKVGIMMGLACHEAAHAVHTDQKLLMKEAQSGAPELQALRKHIWNIIEDERIEYHLGDEHPGFAELLAHTKRYYFKKLRADMMSAGKQMPTEPLPRLLATLTQAVRYPSELTREEVTEDFDNLNAIRKALSPYPLTPDGAWKATDRVMDIISDLVKKELEKQQQQQQQQQQQGAQQGGAQQEKQQGGGSSQGQSSQDDNQSGSSGQGDQQQQGGGKKGKKKDAEQSAPSSPDQSQPPTRQEIEQAIARALSTEQGKRVMEALRKDDEKSSSANASRDVTGTFEQQFINDDSAEMDSPVGGSGRPSTWLFRPKGNAALYARSLRKVSPYIPAMSAALSCKSHASAYVLRGERTGKMNTNRLTALATGNRNIFIRRGEVTCSSASVCILIDESGSMSRQKEERAREAAILINEAVRRIPNVNFYCYGYTSHIMNIYAEGPRSSRWSLSETGSRSGTPTGEAMRLAAKRVRKMTQDPVLMLILTDGAADNNDKVVAAKKALDRDGFVTIGVGILCNYGKDVFENYVEVENISTLAFDLGKVTKRFLDKMLVRSDSLR